MDKTLNIKIKFSNYSDNYVFLFKSMLRFKNVSMLEILYYEKRYNFNKIIYLI